MEVRDAREEDADALLVIDLATWATGSPSPLPGDDATFFGKDTRPEDVLVAAEGATVLGYVKVVRPTPLPSNAHVRHVAGLAVDPVQQRRGVGRLLVEAAVARAAAEGATRLTLRVLGHNAGALRLYEACGFVREGVLRGEFVLGGVPVDDVLMARDLP